MRQGEFHADKISVSVTEPVLLFSLGGFGVQTKKFRVEFSDLFDTITTLTGYAENQNEFDRYADVVA